MQFKKPILLIALLLIILFSTGFITNNYLEKSSERLGNEIKNIQIELSKNIDIENANNTRINNYWLSFKNMWNGIRTKWAIVIDHSEIDMIESSIARIDKLIPLGDYDDALPECSILEESVSHIFEKEKVNLKNIL